MFRSLAVVVLALSGAQAFAPASRVQSFNTELNAESRREALGNLGIALGGLLVGTLAAPEESMALTNPALQTFKGAKGTKGQFIPGKGMRNKEDELLAVNNPALETFKGGKKTKGNLCGLDD